jgi:Phage integrase, N-terminal SAM-like domain
VGRSRILRHPAVPVTRPVGDPRAAYETIVRLYIVPGLGTKRLDQLTVRDVQTWINQIPKACQCCLQGKDAKRREDKRRCCAIGKCCRSAPSARTIGDIRKVLRSALSQAVTEELIGKNVAVPIKLPASRPAKRKSWSSAEALCLPNNASTLVGSHFACSFDLTGK